MFLKPRLFLIVNALLLLAGIRCAQAGEIKIVSPSAYKDVEGPGPTVPEGDLTPLRYQGVFPAEDFAALGNKPHWLVDTSLRPDEILTSSRTVFHPDSLYRFATTQSGPGDLSTVFDNNLGSDFKQFYRGPETFVADIDGSSPVPREFYVSDRAEVTPYLYDPSQGNLLLDWISWQWASPGPRADWINGMETNLVAASPFATNGGFIPFLVRQFTFIPALETATWNVDAAGNWSLLANWANGFPNLTGAHAVLGSVITAPRTVTVDTPITVGRLDFDNANAYTIAGPQILRLDAMSGDAQINVTRGSHTISASVRLEDNATITVTPAASNLSITGSLNASGRNLSKVGDGTLTVPNVRAAGLSVNGGTVAIAPGGTTSGTSTLGTLAIAGATDAWTAKLDLANNDAVVQSSAANKAVDFARLNNQVKLGFNNGNWQGLGITSATAAANTSADTGLTVVDNALLGLSNFSGQPVTADSILLKYTYYGDIDMNGQVDADDLTVFASNFGRAAGATQVDGDIDFNGAVNADDLTVFANNFNKGVGNPLGAATVAAVPEPATILLVSTAGLLLLLIRRRAALTVTCGVSILPGSDSPLGAGCHASGQEPSRYFG